MNALHQPLHWLHTTSAPSEAFGVTAIVQSSALGPTYLRMAFCSRQAFTQFS
jgi:hypothetical protein